MIYDILYVSYFILCILSVSVVKKTQDRATMHSSIILTLILLMIFCQGKARKYLVETFDGNQKTVEVEKSAFHDRIKFGNKPNYSKGRHQYQQRKISNKALMPNTLTDSIDNQKIASEGKITNM